MKKSSNILVHKEEQKIVSIAGLITAFIGGVITAILFYSFITIW